MKRNKKKLYIQSCCFINFCNPPPSLLSPPKKKKMVCCCCESLNMICRILLAVILFVVLVVILGYPLKAWAYADENNASSSEMASYLSSSEFWTFDEQNLLYGVAAAAAIYGLFLSIALIIWSLCAGCTCVLSFLLACVPWTWRRMLLQKTAAAGHYVRGERRKPDEGLHSIELQELPTNTTDTGQEEVDECIPFRMEAHPGYMPALQRPPKRMRLPVSDTTSESEHLLVVEEEPALEPEGAALEV
jgi:hypothetical protein